MTPPDSADGAVPAGTLKEGHLIARGTSLGRYIVVRHLGTGGQGVVYAAYDPELDRSVALKLLRPDLGVQDADERRTRLLKEAQEHAQLQHPNVVPILHVGTFFDQLYLAMPLMSGGTLADWLKSPRPAREVVKRFLEAGQGLAAAHARGLVHRDFKPENVLLDERGVAHVTDFGLAQRGDAAGGVGTKRYMAPEQRERTGVVGRAADQYALCVALCEALTGQLPTVSDDGALQKLPPAPPWLRTILPRGLAKSPAERFPSMEALLAALELGPEARSRFLARASLLVLVGVTAVAVGRLLSRETETERTERLCREKVQGFSEETWGRPRATAIEQRFQQVSGAMGADVFARVSDLVTPELKAWTEASTGDCVKPLSVAAERCLEGRARTLQSLSELFSTAESAVVTSALTAVRLELQPVADCLGPTVTAPRVVPDSEVDQRLRPTLARALVLRAAGQYEDALSAALAVGERARAEGAARVQAESQLLAAQLMSELKRPGTEALLLGAVTLAERASADTERARAYLALITWYASRDDFEAASRAREQAEAIIERLGRPPQLEAQLENQVGQLLRQQGDAAGASKAFKRAVELRRQSFDEGHPLVSRALTNYALTLPASEAVPILEQLLATRARVFGEQHPETAIAAHNLGVMLNQLDARRALPPLERALHIWQGQARVDTCRLAREHFTLSRAYEASRDGLPSALEAQWAGLRALGGADCTTTLAVDQELQRLLDLSTRLARPRPELDRVSALLALALKKEPLPADLGP